jgi:hypothetical protein
MLFSREEIVDMDGADVSTALECTLEAGECALFDVNIVHDSRPNRGAGRRVGLAIRYLATSIPHHETFSTTIQPPYSSTKG